MSEREQEGPGKRTRNVSIQAELDNFVNALVESGDFANYSEVVRTALREMRRREEERNLFLKGHGHLSVGIKQALAGQFSVMDPQSIRRKA